MGGGEKSLTRTPGRKPSGLVPAPLTEDGGRVSSTMHMEVGWAAGGAAGGPCGAGDETDAMMFVVQSTNG
jgi:hypothetical protein